MKTSIYSLLFLFCSLNQQAQNFNFAYHGGIESSGPMRQINGKTFYLLKNISLVGCCAQGVKLVGRDENNDTLFERNVSYDPHVDYFNMETTTDGHIIAFAGTMYKGCDYGGPRFRVLVVDSTGNVLCTKTFLKRIHAILPSQNGTFRILSSDSIHKFTLQGLLLSKVPCVLNAQASFQLSSGNYAIGTGGSAPRLKIIDSLGNQLFDVASSPVKAIHQLSSGVIITIAGGDLFSYSSSLTAISSSTTSIAPGLSLTAFFVKNDTIYASGIDPWNVPVLLALDGNLALLSQTSGNMEQVVPTGIALTPSNRLRLVVTASGSAHLYSGYFETGKFGGLDASRDVGVVQLSQISYSLVNAGYYYYPVISAQVKVKNYGTDTVHYFKLNSFSYMGGTTSCYRGLQQQFLVVIPPGDSTTVQTTTFNGQHFTAGGLLPDGSFLFNFCVYSSVPDKLNDSNVSNNGACGSFLIQTVGIEAEDPDLPLSLYPNPAREMVMIKSHIEFKSLRIFNAQGKEVFVKSEGLEEVDVSDLPNGVYLIKVATQKGFLNKKLLIHR